MLLRRRSPLLRSSLPAWLPAWVAGSSEDFEGQEWEEQPWEEAAEPEPDAELPEYVGQEDGQEAPAVAQEGEWHAGRADGCASGAARTYGLLLWMGQAWLWGAAVVVAVD